MDINSGVKIRLVQMEVTPANPRKNFDECKHYVDEAKRDGIQVVVFPELCISGYLIGDMWEELSFLEDCEHYGEMLAKESTASTAIIFGNVYVDRNLHGTDGRVVKLNGAFVAYNGTFVKNKFTNPIMYPKTLLPNYREFEEPRHFKDCKWYSEHTGIRFDDFFLPYTLFGVKFGITICEDGWDRDYIDKPVKNVVNAGADIVINLSCSPFTLNKNVSRDRVFSAHAKDNEIPICYVNSIGLQNNGKTLFTFDGSTIAYNLTGNTISTIDMFTEGTTDVVMFAGELYPVGIVNDNQYTEIEQTYNAIIYGIRKYMEMSGLKKVVIGSSGGVDSAVSAALYVDAIGAENVYLVNMPSRYNSATTKGLSQQLADNLGTPYTVVPIGDSVELTKTQIDAVKFTDANGTMYPDVKLSAFNLENVQARDRSARVLSAIASAIDAVFTNNGNKTETTVGYATLYGDVAGFMATIADLWKTQVYALGAYINERHGKEVIPTGIFTIVASAELSDAQNVDEGKGDPIVYWYHDFLFRSWVEKWDRATPTEILEHYIVGDLFKFLGINRPETDINLVCATPQDFVNDLERWWKLFKGMAVAKRVQAPPVLALTRRSYGFDYRETLNGVYFSNRYLQMKEYLGI